MSMTIRSASRSPPSLSRTLAQTASRSLLQYPIDLLELAATLARNVTARFRRPLRANLVWFLFCVLILVVAGGCLSRPPLVKQSFAFALPSVLTNTPAATDRSEERR